MRLTSNGLCRGSGEASGRILMLTYSKTYSALKCATRCGQEDVPVSHEPFQVRQPARF